MSDESTDPIEMLLEDVHEIHQSLWADAAPPASRKEEQQRLMLERMRDPHRGPGAAGCDHRHHGRHVPDVVLKLACFNHKFAEGGFERCLSGIGPVMGPVGDILNGLGHEIQDEGPLPECGSWARSSSRSGA